VRARNLGYLALLVLTIVGSLSVGELTGMVIEVCSSRAQIRLFHCGHGERKACA
jgi:hypothetical protein